MSHNSGEDSNGAGLAAVTLKLCPFCNGEPEHVSGYWFEGSWRGDYVRCKNPKCRARNEKAYCVGDPDAVAAWETRTNQTTSAPVTQEDARDLISAIINAYHTTRLRDSDLAGHILSKSPVQKAFARLATRPDQIASPAQPDRTKGIEAIVANYRFSTEADRHRAKEALHWFARRLATEQAAPAQPGAELVPRFHDEQIKHMVNRFLMWKLPANFNPDNGISFEPEFNKEWNAKQGKPPQCREPVGTNLLDAIQAEAMVRHMLDGLPTDEPAAIAELVPHETGEALVERVAWAICQSKGINPNSLYQHNFEGDYPEDERREYDDPFTGEPRVQLFHRAWRHSYKAARAALSAILEPAVSIAELVEAWERVCDQLGHIEGGMSADLEDAASALDGLLNKAKSQGGAE